MKTRLRWLWIVLVLTLPIAAILVLTAPAASGPLAAGIDPEQSAGPTAPTASPVVFLGDPDSPPYAQTAISVFPDPPEVGRPTETCVWLINTDNISQTVTVDFGAANFGMGVPFDPVGSRTITIPPHRSVRVCVVWIPPKEGHWCVGVILHVPGWSDQQAQRNIDVWETLVPGVPAPTQFMLGNPLSEAVPIHLDLKLNPQMVGWQASLPFIDIPQMNPGQIMPVTLIVTPPLGVKLGTRNRIVDVEATALTVPTPTLIGGFRKMDWPPVLLHRAQDPPYAESEISVAPYPPMAGEPTHICVELYNQSDVPQTTNIIFQVSGQLGIGLPFTPIDLQTVTIPPHSSITVCTTWIPPRSGHFCVQITLHDPQGAHVDQQSQRNMDVNEILMPGVQVPFTFPVQNPNPYATVITMSAMRVSSFFDVFFDVPVFNLGPGEIRLVTAFVTRLPGPMPASAPGTVIADIEATFVNDQRQPMLLGGIRKEFHPPIPIHRPDDPPYAEREISIEPYPPRAGEPTQICVELRNPTNISHTIMVEFAVANFGIGLPFQPLQVMPVTLPPNSIVKRCITWVPPFAGHFCAQITLLDPLQRFPPVKSQRNMDVGEVFAPGQWTRPFVFLVGNPSGTQGDIQLAPVIHLPGWQAVLDPPVLTNVAPVGDVRPVTLTVMPPPGVPLPEDETPVVDVEGYLGGQLIGGFRKIYRPPVPIHIPGDPVYAEREISINPYPPREREPTEICVDVRNPTDVTQTITVTFAVANFGIGLPFHDIARPIAVTLPPNSIKRVCVTWVPPFGGHFCAQVTLQIPGHEPVWSQRNMDVSEILLPGRPSPYTFLVGNPTRQVVTVTLGKVLYQQDWDVALSQDTLTNMQPGEQRPVTLVVTPTVHALMPLDGAPVVDVEGYIGRQLIGGFRKIYRPPVPIHIPGDPVYAESEIFVDPYPVQINMPTLLGAIVHNPTNVPQTITVTFSVAHFGIGMPFSITGILTPTMVVNVPPNGAARVSTRWIAQYRGLVCVQIQLQSAGHDPIISRRNIDVGEPLKLGVPHSRIIEVRNPLTDIVTLTLALINHRPDWDVSITPTLFASVASGQVVTATLTVRPPAPSTDPDELKRQLAGLADGLPIADVEAYINGELIGGIRKIARPPIPLHRLQDRPYSESEIGVTPYPLVAGQPAAVTADIINTGDETQTIRVLFGVANFGMGIPFTTTGIITHSVVVTLGPGISQTVMTVWNPPASGHWCIQIILQDPNNQYPDQRSQRNVEVVRRTWLPCQPFTKDFLLQNPTPLTVTVTLGASAINLPLGWTYSTSITETTLNPYQSITVTLTITPPCSLTGAPVSAEALLDTGGASGPAEINVEAYADGKLLIDGAGIQVQLELPVLDKKIYLPIVLRQ